MQSPWRDDHDASRLFLPDLIRQLKVKGRHVVSAPSRSVLLVTGDQDAAGLAALPPAVEAVIADDPNRQVWGGPQVLQDHTWRPFLPPTDNPLHESYRRLHISSMAVAYEDQKSLLDNKLEKQREDVHVASFTIVSRPLKPNETSPDDSIWSSYSVWAQGVTKGLLPEAESLMLILDDKDVVGPIPWVRTPNPSSANSWNPPITGHARWRITTFPSEQQLEALRKLAE